ncbi:MAG: hypothetical protein Q3M30_15535 [Candidatus Electrothrix sp. Rat3]|nr:hypothetical protein [Candidatus Electrothrix rattekaaiensis]
MARNRFSIVLHQKRIMLTYRRMAKILYSVMIDKVRTIQHRQRMMSG